MLTLEFERGEGWSFSPVEKIGGGQIGGRRNMKRLKKMKRRLQKVKKGGEKGWSWWLLLEGRVSFWA